MVDVKGIRPGTGRAQDGPRDGRAPAMREAQGPAPDRLPPRSLSVQTFLSRPDIPMFARLDLEFQKLARLSAPTLAIERVLLPDDDPATYAQAIRSTTADAMILYATQDQQVVDAIDAARARGVVTVTIVSDIPQSRRLAYVGNDHVAAGQMAGLFARSLLPQGGDVLILRGFAGVFAHGQRIAGFCNILNRSGAFTLLGIATGRDDDALSEQAMRQVLQGRRVDCIYNVGAANLAVAAVIRDQPPGRRPVFIGYELTAQSRRLLREGVMTLAIDQNPEVQLRHALDAIQRHFGQIDGDPPPGDSGPATGFTVYTPTDLGRSAGI